MIKATPDAAVKDFAVVDVRSDDFVVRSSSNTEEREKRADGLIGRKYR